VETDLKEKELKFTSLKIIVKESLHFPLLLPKILEKLPLRRMRSCSRNT